MDIELSGALDKELMRAGLNEVIEKSMDISDGKLLYVISDFEFPTIGALAVELSQLPELFGLLGKFDKCAVVTDVSWLRTAAEIKGAVIPSFQIKSFQLSDMVAAERWLDDELESHALADTHEHLDG
ncbi:STAS/SEC14 domain-containing protein [Roseobacter cerasinus]|uniref:STAS/SEC14 domain-containing protein n=1 Tax=Roseobacter cerasinus TaxID=2602289 RepID=UPI001EEC195B|nr:STAS/SEC14 domain-containing protein [Roseobacter cerasinus]